MKLKSNTFRWMEDSNGTWLCIQTTRKEAVQVCDEAEQGTLYDIGIEKHRQRRSLDANAYAWVLLDKLAEKLRMPKTELYRSYIREIGGNSETVCVLEKAADNLISGWNRNGIGWVADKIPSKLNGCVNVVLYYGSSTYTTSQMSRLITMIIEDCKQQGIETLPPHKLVSMMDEWGRMRV
jgi:hypothetical protein